LSREKAGKVQNCPPPSGSRGFRVANRLANLWPVAIEEINF
jgi:hypothetical protein